MDEDARGTETRISYACNPTGHLLPSMVYAQHATSLCSLLHAAEYHTAKTVLLCGTNH